MQCNIYVHLKRLRATDEQVRHFSSLWFSSGLIVGKWSVTASFPEDVCARWFSMHWQQPQSVLSLESTFLDHHLNTSVTGAPCGSFPITLFPSSKLSMLWYGTLWILCFQPFQQWPNVAYSRCCSSVTVIWTTVKLVVFPWLWLFVFY